MRPPGFEPGLPGPKPGVIAKLNHGPDKFSKKYKVYKIIDIKFFVQIMQRLDAVNPLDFRYLEEDGELKTKINSYVDLDIQAKIKRIMPEILIPRISSLELKVEQIAIENKGKETPKRVDGQHEGKIRVEEVFSRYADRLRNRINDLHRLNSDSSYTYKTEFNEYVSDILYHTLSAFSVEANIADDIRQLFRDEIKEISFKEYSANRVGSSTMPHKINPPEFERIKSLYKAHAPRITSAVLSQITEHQGDSTNDDFPYFAFETLVTIAYCTKSLENLLDNIEIKGK